LTGPEFVVVAACAFSEAPTAEEGADAEDPDAQPAASAAAASTAGNVSRRRVLRCMTVESFRCDRRRGRGDGLGIHL
jgi:hypothetical protein